MVLHRISTAALVTAFGLFGACSAYAQSPGAFKIPGYIKAKPDAMVKAYGAEIAEQVFSGRFTPMRRAKILSTIGEAQGVPCAKNPKVALFNISPFRARKDAIIWVENYAVGCKPAVGRNLLAVFKGGKLQLLEMVRGHTLTDPVLQRDLRRSLGPAVRAKAPKDCKRIRVVDSAVV